VLQLDICKFTNLSQTVPPLEVLLLLCEHVTVPPLLLASAPAIPV
jgi:hypothetical protein